MTQSNRSGLPRLSLLPRVITVLMSLVLGVFLATPAHAADDTDAMLELSRDGVAYKLGSLTSVFADSHGFVPGESRDAKVWVHNVSSEAAYFSLAVANVGRTSSAILPQYLGLQAVATKGLADAPRLPGPGHCTVVLEKWPLKAGETMPMNLDLQLALQAPNATRNQVSDFELLFVMQGVDGGTLVSPCAAVSPTIPAGTSVGRAPMTGGTATSPEKIATLQSNGNNDAGTQYQNFGGANVRGALEGEERSVFSFSWLNRWSGNGLMHSNVAAVTRTPWPWLLALCAVMYTLISTRRRKKTR